MYNRNIKFTMEEIKTKVCRKCGRELPLDKFSGGATKMAYRRPVRIV